MYYISPYILYITTSKCACTKSNLDFFEMFEKCQFRSKVCKILIFFSKFSKIAIFVVILEKSRFWPEFFERSLFWSEFSKNLNYSGNFRKIAILVVIFEKSRFGSKFSINRHSIGNLQKKSQIWWKLKFKKS